MWKLTKGIASSQVGTLLKDLKERSSLIQYTLMIVVSLELRSHQCSETPLYSIKLDLFHAVQRITNTLCKRHLLVQRCMQDLQLVFQQDSDSRVTRMAATPSPEVILSRMNKFVARNQRPRDENIATWPRKRSTCLLTDHRGFLTIVLTPESETMYFEDH